jgi:hypothetical protein
MSSCVASCSIYSHAASSASATSASLPTGNVPDCCHSASTCFAVQIAPQQHRLQQTVITLTGTARCAAQRCMSSNDSQQLNSCSVPRHPTDTPHEPTASPSIPPRVCTRTQTLCLMSLKPRCRPPRSPFPAAQNSLAGSARPARSTYAVLKATCGKHPHRLRSI